MNKSIYLDYAAATPLDPTVLAAMKPFLELEFYNPSATYLAGKRVEQTLETARSEVARALGSRPAEIVFTAGATEANNLAIQGVMRGFPGSEALCSAVEHESVLAPTKIFKNRIIPVNSGGMVDVAKLQKMIGDETVLISVMYVNNEIGTIQSLKEIATILRQVRSERSKVDNKLPIYLHSDAAQAANYLDLHVARLSVDLMSINGGKIYGPKQSGVLFVRTGVRLQPLILGGGQEFGLRSGTENVAGAVGFGQALKNAQELRKVESGRLKKLRYFFANQLQKTIPSAVINGSSTHMAPHILNITIPGIDNERVMMELDEAGVMCAVGSACSAGSTEPSHVLSAIGLSKDQARSSLRFSLGRASSESQTRTTLELLGRFAGADR